MKQTVHEIELNGTRISYTLTRKSVKNINLRIQPDGSVWVSASPRVPMRAIEALFYDKADAVLHAIAHFRAQAVAQRGECLLADGERVFIWGEPKCVSLQAGTRNHAQVIGDTVVLTVKDLSDIAAKQKAFRQLQAKLCQDVLTALCDRYFPYFKARGVPFPTLRFRFMKSRWGSCRAQKGSITFNCYLVEKPLVCAEYVAVHELAHLLQPDHSARFYALVGDILPDWKARRQLLS